MRPTRSNQSNSNQNQDLSEMFIGGDGKLSVMFNTLELEVIGGATTMGNEVFECIRK